MTKGRQIRKRKSVTTEFYTAKRIDNSRVVRHVEPVRMRNLYRTAVLGGVMAAFFMLYIYQHFRCIDLSFQLEEAKSRQAEAVALNSALKLEIAGLSDPKRIDTIARRQLGLTETLPTQVHEYQAEPGDAEVAAATLVRPNRAP
jgi:cell division protein FtsL